jgi:hypothetical protein
MAASIIDKNAGAWEICESLMVVARVIVIRVGERSLSRACV